MNREKFIHINQDKAYERYKDGVTFQKDLETHYEEIDYKMKQADFLGKTVKVTEKQFAEVYELLKELSKKENIDLPDTYVFEDYYYGVESFGISKPWIEISAKTIQDFTKDELKFVLAREIYKIADGVTKQKTMMEERFKMLSQTMPIAQKEIEQIAKISFYHWYRLVNYSADNYGYLMCESVKSSVSAILMMVLNSRMLSEQVDINEFIGQASEINKLDDTVYRYTKADESVPYAPHRIQNLLAYAVSERAQK